MSQTELFDAATFDRALAESPNPLSLFRDTLRACHKALNRAFIEGDPVARLVRGRAGIMDHLLCRAWERNPELVESAALVAVGGYGRGELHPHSDIDLLILVPDDTAEGLRAPLERFLTFLWDIGLEVGHSVRSVTECVSEAEADITVATNLMESRLLAGPEPLYREMRAATGPSRIWPGRRFFEAKWQEQIARHHKFHDTSYNLEPNIKEGPGGLRDIQMVGWVAKRHFGADTLADLVEHGFLTALEHKTLMEGQNFLWRVRFGLHMLAGRREDRLLFDHQRTLARQFGYRDEGPRLPVEQFMKRYYRTVMELNRLNEMLLQLFQEEILYADQEDEPIRINRRFHSRRGFIEVAHPQVFQHFPFALLEIFLLLAQHPEIKGVRAETIRLIRSHRHLIDDEFRADLRCRSLFMEFLRQPHGITHELRRMNRYGVLAAYLPVFGQVAGQMQHDLFHVYTVDEHTLFVVRNLRRLMVPELGHEFPLCSRIMQRIPKPELLYIAALFHDIAKGRGGDHSELGADEVTAFCEHHALSAYDTRLTAWLVRNHLLMSTTAQRKDTSDPQVISDFAAQVGDINHLNYLYLLTVADIRATSPTLWNSWKDALLADLYQTTRTALRRGIGNPIDQEELIREAQQQARRLVHNRALQPETLQPLWRRLGDDYFLRYSADEIAWHAEALLDDPNHDLPLILLRQETQRGGTEIFIYAPLGERLFALTTSTLDQMNLTIVDARIIPSNDGYSLDTYIVLEENGTPISDPYRIQEIQQTLHDVIARPELRPSGVQRHLPRQLKHFPIPTQVVFAEDPRNHRTAMEVIASDRPGLLSKVGQALTGCGVRLRNAKIATLGERVEDIFFIVDPENRPITEPRVLECLRTTITELLAS